MTRIKFWQKLIIWLVVILEIVSFSQLQSISQFQVSRVRAEEIDIPEEDEPDDDLYPDLKPSDGNKNADDPNDIDNYGNYDEMVKAIASKEPVNDTLTADERGQIEQGAVQILVYQNKVPGSLAAVVSQKQELDNFRFGGSLEKIYFENLVDEFAIFGESCKVPGLQSWLPLSEEEVRRCDDWLKSDEGRAYDIFPNGRWDGPRFEPVVNTDLKNPGQNAVNWRGKTAIVDARIIEMLRYLVTPTWQGGAGRERIKIKKIVQFNEKDVEAKNPEVDEGGEEPEPQKSAHYIGEIREGRPITKTVQAIDISEIDAVRLTTKITKKKRVGGDKTSYKFQRPFGVKVAWQDDYGQNRAGLPPVDAFTGAEDFFRNGLVDLLSDFEITDAIAPGDLADVDLESLTRFVGAEVLGQILEAPRGSLEGFDLVDTLEKFGRSVIADQLKLPRQAFASGETINDIERNIGQAILEKRFDLPEGAFAGKSSSIMLFNIGRRWLEEDVFQVRPGALDYDTKGLADEQAQFYPRLGAGRIERAFNFKPGTFDPNKSYDDLSKAAGLRFQLVFDKDGKNDAAIDEKLGITIIPTDQIVGNAFENDENGTANATKQWRQKTITTQKYLDLIGHWVFNSSIGTLNQSLPTDPAAAVDEFVRGTGEYSPQKPSQGILMPYGYNENPLQYYPPDTNWSDSRNIANVYNTQVGNLKSLLRQFEDRLKNENALKETFPTAVYDRLKPAISNIQSDSYRLIYGYTTDPAKPTLLKQLLNNLKFENGVWVPPLASDDVVNIVHQIADALVQDIKKTNQALAIVYEGIDRTTLKGVSEERQQFITALENVRQATYQFIEALNQARQMGGLTPADQAMALTGSPFLVQAQVKNPDGENFQDNSTIAKLRDGDRSIFTTIGMIKLSQKTSDSPEEQAAIQVNLFENTQSLFDTVTGAANQFGLGLSEPRVRGRFGLLAGDYDRMFTKNMGSEVFERIGKAELLASVWNHPEFQEEVQKIRQNSTYQEMEQIAAEANQDFNFYLSRLNQINELVTQIISGLNGLTNAVEANVNQRVIELYPGEVARRQQHVPPLPALTLDQAQKDLGDRFQSSRFTSVGSAIDFLTETEMDLRIIYEAIEAARVGGVAGANDIYQKSNTVRHLIQEITAGKAMPFDRPDNLQVDPLDQDYSLPKAQERRQSCWSASQLISVLRPAGDRDIGSTLVNGLRVVGACELDKRLTLPIGSLYDFYQTDDHTLTNFILSVGRASYKEKNQGIPGNDQTVEIEGRRVLTQRVIQRLALQSGAFREITKKYPMTEETIYQMVMGNEKQAATAFGGSLIDSRLKLTPGTTAELIDPCLGPSAIVQARVEFQRARSCSELNAKNREEVRAHILAREGLRQLGFEIDIPWNVDLTRGNFRDNFGKAQFESILGLHDFDGEKIQDVIDKNGVGNFLAAIGAPPTPYLALLNNLQNIVKQELTQLPYVGDVNQSPIAKLFSGKAQAASPYQGASLRTALAELEKLASAEKTKLLEELKNPAPLSYYWWPTDPARPNLTYQQIINDLTDPFDIVVAERQKFDLIDVDLYTLLPDEAKRLVNSTKNQYPTDDQGNNALAMTLANNAFLFKVRIRAAESRLNGASYMKDSNERELYRRQDIFGTDQNTSSVRIMNIVQGNISPDKLNEQAGDYALWNMGVQLLGSKYKDTFIGQVIGEYSQFAEVVGAPSLADIFSGQAKDNGFDWDNLAENLWNSNSNQSVQARTWFFDRFLARSFSTKFDEDIGFEPGTMRNLFARPNMARQIMIDQGIMILASEFFRADRQDNNDVREGKFALLQVFNAGFMVSCSTDIDDDSIDQNIRREMKQTCQANNGQDYYSLKFNRSRAFGQFRTTVYNKLENIVNDKARDYLGVSIPLSDLNSLIHGDLHALGFVAAAYTITQVNTDGDKPIDGSRLVSYNTARLATIGSPNAQAVIQAGAQAMLNYDQKLCQDYGYQDCDTQAGVDGHRDEIIIRQTQINQPDGTRLTEVQSKAAYERNKNAAGRLARDRANSDIRDQAMKTFQYQMMDAALYKLDKNIPLGFAEAFFSSGATEETRNDAGLLFVMNYLSTEGGGSWGEFLSVFKANTGRDGFSFASARSFRTFLDTLSSGVTEQIFGAVLANQGLTQFAYKNINQWFSSAFDTNLDQQIFQGFLAWGATGELDGSFEYDGKKILSLTDSVENWAQNKIFAWADRSLGFDVGVSAQIYDAGKNLYDAYKNYDWIKGHNALDVGVRDAFAAKDPNIDLFDNKALAERGEGVKKTAGSHLKEAQAQFITFAVTTIFKSQIASMENKLGLVPGTGAMAVGMLINLIIGVPIDPITIALFIGLNLFGYYKIVVKVQGTADGYYPFVGAYGDFTMGGVEVETNSIRTGSGSINVTQVRRVNFQYPSPDPPIGEFDAKDGAGYKAGLKTAALAKIEGLLIDLATAPERWNEALKKNDPESQYANATYNLMPSQVFTKLPEHIDDVQAFISRPPCRSQTNVEQNGGCGYGPVDERNKKGSGFWTVTTDPDEASFWDHIHVAW